MSVNGMSVNTNEAVQHFIAVRTHGHHRRIAADRDAVTGRFAKPNCLSADLAIGSPAELRA
jgi:hypothetical protein